MVYRVYAEKKEGLRDEAATLRNEARALLGISRLEDVRIIDRYDVDNISEELFEECIWKVFAEPQLDNVSGGIDELFLGDYADIFAVEMLPDRLDQRADSAEQCIRFIKRGEKPIVRCAKVYALYGELMPADIDAIKHYLIDQTGKREASMDMPEKLDEGHKISGGASFLEGFTSMDPAAYSMCIDELDLAMDEDDLDMCVSYFRDIEQRDPTITEIKVIDAHWSDRCGHSSFDTVIDSVTFEDVVLEKAYKDYLALRKDLGRDKPVTLDDIATIAAKHLRRLGKLEKLDESEGAEAGSIKINVEVDGVNEPWVLLFRSVSRNNATEADPVSGAGSCLGTCISEALSGKAYAFSAMRVSGSADPLQPVAETIPGKLPQRSITQAAAKGFSSYANQAGIPTGIVEEIYHPGYAAKRMETAAVVAAAPAVHLRREPIEAGDLVMLVGRGAGRDAVKEGGDPIEKRKLRRLFKSGVATRMIKRCNNIGAGGISVALGELAEGLEIDLSDADLATSELQERMACVIAASNEELFMTLAAEENLECARIASVTELPRLVMRLDGDKIVDISRRFLDTGGSGKHIDIAPVIPGDWNATSMYAEARSFTAAMRNLAQDLNTCSKRGLAERFDSTVGTGTVLMPFGGKNQLTPIQAMAHKFPVGEGNTDDCALMAFGYNPFLSSASPYHGAYLAVVESVSKLIATGASYEDVFLMFQEYFESPKDGMKRWGQPLAALLGAFEAQMNLEVASIVSKGSMDGSSGVFDVPPSLVSFAVTMGKAPEIVSPEFKSAGHKVIWLKPYREEDSSGVGYGLPNPESVIRVWNKAYELISTGKAVAAYTPGMGGVAEAIMKMCYGNGIGFEFRLDKPEADAEQGDSIPEDRYKKDALKDIFGYSYGSIILEMAEDEDIAVRSLDIGTLGYTTEEKKISFAGEDVDIGELLMLYEGKLESVFPNNTDTKTALMGNVGFAARSWHVSVYKRSEPKVLIPVFPGSNGEYDSARLVREAGASAEIMVIRNRNSDDIRSSVEQFAAAVRSSQIIFIPGGCTGGDEPGGAAKLITTFFRNAEVSDAVMELLDRQDGLMLGTGNGFQALLKLGLLPYGKITDVDDKSPALTFNILGAHQSKIVRVRVASNRSPWLRYNEIGSIYSVPVAHCEGRFIASESVLRHLAGAGQIATQYADLEGNASADIRFNPSGSMLAVEGLTSLDGRVFGKMGHLERTGKDLYKNVEGKYIMDLFSNAIRYFK